MKILTVFIIVFILNAAVDSKVAFSKKLTIIKSGPKETGHRQIGPKYTQEGYLYAQLPENKQSASSFGQTGPFNFYESIPRVLELTGLGLLWIRSLGVATGLPFFYPILIPLLFILATVLAFVPNEDISFMNLVNNAQDLILG